MTGPASPLLRDLGLIDAALLATVQGLLARELAVSGALDRTLCRLAAERLLSVAETLAGLVARPDETADAPPGLARHVERREHAA